MNFVEIRVHPKAARRAPNNIAPQCHSALYLYRSGARYRTTALLVYRLVSVYKYKSETMTAPSLTLKLLSLVISKA